MLTLARNTIESCFPGFKRVLPKLPDRKQKRVPLKLREKRACFVTLSFNGQLRGCIGHILPIQELYFDVIENAKAAAFNDPRFPPLSASELKNLEIEISVLSIPKPFSSSRSGDLTAYLGKNKPGVILKQGLSQATFLPQVWEDIPDPQKFLSHLSMKAGLLPDAWKNGVTIKLYEAEKIQS